MLRYMYHDNNAVQASCSYSSSKAAVVVGLDIRRGKEKAQPIADKTVHIMASRSV